MIKPRHQKTFETVTCYKSNRIAINYVVKHEILNSQDFDLPPNTENLS